MSARGVGASPLLDRLLDQLEFCGGGEGVLARQGQRHRIYAARDRRMPPCRAAEGRRWLLFTACGPCARRSRTRPRVSRRSDNEIRHDVALCLGLSAAVR